MTHHLIAMIDLPVYAVLDICFLASELRLALSRQSARGTTRGASADRGSLRMLWIVICVALTAGHMVDTAASAAGGQPEQS